MYIYVCIHIYTFGLWTSFGRSTAQATQPILTRDRSKDAVEAEKVPSNQVFFKMLTSLGHFPLKPPNVHRQCGNLSQIDEVNYVLNGWR
jgi:hypothetical protein